MLLIAAPKTFNKKRYDFRQHVLLDAMTDVFAIASDTGANNHWFRVSKLDNERATHDFSVKTKAGQLRSSSSSLRRTDILH